MKIMEFMTQNNAFAVPIPKASVSILNEIIPVWIGVDESSGVKK